MNGPCECAGRLDELAAANDRMDAALKRAEAILARQARDQAKQQDKTVASLATQIRGLRDLLSRAGITGTADLATQVAALTRTVGDLTAAGPPGRGPAMPCWDQLASREYQAELSRLRAWVAGMLGKRYVGPAGLASWGLRECWPAHPLAVEYLSALHTEWMRVAGGRRRDTEGMLGWLHKWLPMTQATVAGELKNCTTAADCRAAQEPAG